MVKYIREFKLRVGVDDLKAANEYLQWDKMLRYFDEGPLKEKLISVEWELKTPKTGEVTVIASSELTDEEIKEIEKEIDGQNSDGLGEGFCQQDFIISEEMYSDDKMYKVEE